MQPQHVLMTRDRLMSHLQKNNINSSITLGCCFYQRWVRVIVSLICASFVQFTVVTLVENTTGDIIGLATGLY